jgi:hypothetical protein
VASLGAFERLVAEQAVRVGNGRHRDVHDPVVV